MPRLAAVVLAAVALLLAAAVPAAGATAPPAPGALTASVAGERVVLRWPAVARARGYEVQRRAGAAWRPVVRVGRRTRVAVARAGGLFRVRALGAGRRRGRWSPVARVVTTYPARPAAAAAPAAAGAPVVSGARTAGSRPSSSAPAAAPAPPAPPAAAGAPLTASPAPAVAPVAVPAGALHVAPAGSDAAAGTEAAPFRTIARALRAATPGAMVVVRAGTYGAPGVTTQVDRSGRPGAPVTLAAFPGERPVLLGHTRITGSHLRIAGLTFDGPTGAVLPRTAANPGGEEVVVSVMYGTDVELSGNEVRDGAWHAGIYVATSGTVRLLGNHVHHNGAFDRPDQANLDHGIYWGEGSGEIAGNLVEENLAFGIHLYPGASDVRVHHNTVARHGRSGIIVASQSRGTVVERNLVVHNAQNSIRSFDLTGTGNVARANVAWGNGGGNLGAQTEGLALDGNVAVDPRLAGPRDYRLTTASPAAVRDAGAFPVAG